MRNNLDIKLAFGVMALLLIMVGFVQSWGVALAILNLCLISAVMSMGVNIQWGYSGLINFGVMGFLAIGVPCYHSRISTTGKRSLGRRWIWYNIIWSHFVCVNYKHFLCASKISIEIQKLFIILFGNLSNTNDEISCRTINFAIESIDAATSGFLGGFDLPIILSWFVSYLCGFGSLYHR